MIGFARGWLAIECGGRAGREEMRGMGREEHSERCPLSVFMNECMQKIFVVLAFFLLKKCKHIT